MLEFRKLEEHMLRYIMNLPETMPMRRKACQGSLDNEDRPYPEIRQTPPSICVARHPTFFRSIESRGPKNNIQYFENVTWSHK